MPEYVSRLEAAAILSAMFSRRVTKKALARLAEQGKGPPYVIILREASYPRDELAAWAEAAPQPPRARAQATRLGAAAPLAA
jgi:hypothetical protein